jgi:hypothetical protein
LWTVERRVLLDNHSPFGYHLHIGLPHEKNKRITIDVENYEEDELNEERGNKIPRLKFNYDRILVERPDYPYEISFKPARSAA